MTPETHARKTRKVYKWKYQLTLIKSARFSKWDSLSDTVPSICPMHYTSCTSTSCYLPDITSILILLTSFFPPRTVSPQRPPTILHLLSVRSEGEGRASRAWHELVTQPFRFPLLASLLNQITALSRAFLNQTSIATRIKVGKNRLKSTLQTAMDSLPQVCSKTSEAAVSP